MLPSNRTFVFLSIAGFCSIFLLPLLVRAAFGGAPPEPELVGAVLFGFLAFTFCILPLLVRALFGLAQRRGVLQRFAAATGRQAPVGPAAARYGADLVVLGLWAIWLAGVGIAATGVLWFGVT
jgi:heme exporter protein D